MKTKVVLLFQGESSHAIQSLAPLVETKTKKNNSFKIIIGFFFTSQLFLATKVAISFVYYSPKTIKCTQKPKIEKKFTGIDQSSECHSPHHIYNSLLCMQWIWMNLLKILYRILKILARGKWLFPNISVGNEMLKFVKLRYETQKKLNFKIWSFW